MPEAAGVIAEAAGAPPAHAVAAVTHADPYPWYRQLRQHRPLYFDPALQFWVASSQALIREVLAQPAWRVRPPGEPVPPALQGTALGTVFGQWVRMRDGAFHAAHKPAVLQSVVRWGLAEVARASEAAVADLLPRVAANALLDWLPVQVMARLLGLPDSVLDPTCAQVRHIVLGMAPGAGPAAVALASGAAQALVAQGQAQGLDAVQAANRLALMQQSLDATAGLLGHSALMLARHPQQAGEADRSLDAMRDFVAEVERHQAPIQNTRRFAAQALKLGGHDIAAGQGVLLLLASGNRDAALNARPDVFDPRRGERRSLGFGAGAHACPGAPIAIEIVAVSARLIRATGRFDAYFGPQTAWRPLANARVPVFEA